MVEGDFGLVEGEMWWMDEATAVFWCAEILDAGATHGARVDLGVKGQTVDVVCKIKRLFSRKEARVKRGFVLQSTYELRRAGDQDRLFDRLRQINPDFAHRYQQIEKERTTAPRTSPRSEPTGPESKPPETRKGSSREAPSSRESSSSDPKLMLHPGKPPSLLVQFQSPLTVRQSLELTAREVGIIIPTVGELATGDQILLVLQIPPGMYLQCQAKVERLARKRLKLVLTGLDPTQLSQLRRAAGER